MTTDLQSLIDACAREPIHIPSAIQPYGALLALVGADLQIAQVSENVQARCGVSPSLLLGRPLATWLGDGICDAIAAALASGRSRETLHDPLTLSVGGGSTGRASFRVTLHRSGEVVVLELEPHDGGRGAGQRELSAHLGDVLTSFARTKDAAELCQLASQEIQRLTGFDRVMVYRFEPDWHGVVIAETRTPHVESFMGLHFPASDIPEQARRLYTLSWLRLIVDAGYEPAALVPQLNPATGRPLDMSQCVLRSVSPVHLEYLRNMGVGASMSVSLLRDGGLWGLVACHHRTARFVPHDARLTCELIARILSDRLETLDERRRIAASAARKSTHVSLLEQVVQGADPSAALVGGPVNLLHVVDAGGAAFCSEGGISVLGRAPPEQFIAGLVAWLQENVTETVWATDCLSRDYPASIAHRDVACGLLAVRPIPGSPGFLLWFRPELVRTVSWAGAPDKAMTADVGGLRIAPRRSFALWQQSVELLAAPWSEDELSAAKDIVRASLIADVLEKARKLEALNRELARTNAELARSNAELDSFAMMLTHDLKAPLRGIANLVSWIEEDSVGTMGQALASHVALLRSRVRRLEALVDAALTFARADRLDEGISEVDVGALVAEVVDLAAPPAEVTVTVDPGLPTLSARRASLQRVWLNLIANALKHGRGEPPEIRIGGRSEGGLWTFWVADNGKGIAPQYHERIFGLFATMQSSNDVTSTGIGLALVKKLVNEAGGTIRVESTPGRGAKFLFTWPAAGA